MTAAGGGGDSGGGREGDGVCSCGGGEDGVLPWRRPAVFLAAVGVCGEGSGGPVSGDDGCREWRHRWASAAYINVDTDVDGNGECPRLWW